MKVKLPNSHFSSLSFSHRKYDAGMLIPWDNSAHKAQKLNPNSEKNQEWCFPGVYKKRFIFPLDSFSKKKKKWKQTKTKQNNTNWDEHPNKWYTLQAIIVQHVLLLSIGWEEPGEIEARH